LNEALPLNGNDGCTPAVPFAEGEGRRSRIGDGLVIGADVANFASGLDDHALRDGGSRVIPGRVAPGPMVV
jgi:hypothetical protein